MNMMIGKKAPGVTRITYRNADGTAAGRRTVSKSSSGSKAKNKAKKQKKLQYNFKEISTKLLQTKTSGTASRVMILARSRAALLRQKLASGDYDDRELESAIIHADAMVRAARKRMKHLRAEEQAEQGMTTPVEETEEREEVLDLTAFTDDGSKVQQEMQEISRETAQELARELQRIMEETMEETMRETSKALQDTLELVEVTEDLAGAVDEMEPADLEQLKKKHRADELREIMEADMKYLKALFDKLAKEKQSSAVSLPGSGEDNSPAGNTPDMAAATLEIGGTDIPVPDAAAVAETVGGSVDVAI